MSDPATYTSVVSTVFTDFGANLLTAAPALLGIGLIAFGVPFVFRWAKRLVG
jgi:hypothetical protein